MDQPLRDEHEPHVLLHSMSRRKSSTCIGPHAASRPAAPRTLPLPLLSPPPPLPPLELRPAS